MSKFLEFLKQTLLKIMKILEMEFLDKLGFVKFLYKEII